MPRKPVAQPVRPPKWPGLLIAALTLLVFAPAAGSDFISYDDGPYAAGNPRVLTGLTPANIAWAFTSVRTFYWHPLTWLSLQLDATLWGSGPQGFHVTNLLLHAASAFLLYTLLLTWTARPWPAALATALFAVHPLRVESVAWVAERKDVLAMLLSLAALHAYTRWTGQPASRRWWLMIAATVAAYMAKPSAIVLPVLFLIADSWPLQRPQPLAALVREKALLIGAAIPVAVLTWFGQAAARDMPVGNVTPGTQLANAAIASAAYLGKTVWPHPLAILYPYREQPAWLLALGSMALLAALTAAAWRARHGRPWLWFGWLWYLAALAPVSGIVQAGPQSMADRFTYLPHIGLFVALAWTLAGRLPARALMAAGAALVLLAAAHAHAYTRLWHDSTTLFAHTVAVTGPNPVARHNLGFALAAQGRHPEAIPHYREAIRLQPGYSQPHYNLGLSLYQTGSLEQAAAAFAESARRRPSYAEAHFSHARCLTGLNRPGQAIAAFARALDAGLPPALASQAHNNWGALLARQGRLAEALSHFEEALRLDPASAEARRNRDLLRPRAE